jgi:Na+-driven multidrug efflux pump
MLISRYQTDAIWWSFPVSSALAAVLAVLYYKYGGWRSARMAGGPRQGVIAPSPEG